MLQTHTAGRTSSEESVLPAAMDTTVCLSVKCSRTSFSTGCTNCGLTAKNTMSLFSTTCNAGHRHSRRLTPACMRAQRLGRPTSTLLAAALASKLWNTFFLSLDGSLAVMSPACSTPLAMKPRASASAICPAPMKPTRFSILTSAILNMRSGVIAPVSACVRRAERESLVWWLKNLTAFQSA